MVLPAIWISAMGYIRFLEDVLKLDTHPKPEGILDRLFELLLVLPMIPVMLLAIFLAGIPWMFLMSRVLSWADLEFFNKPNKQRLPLFSDWTERLWVWMIKSRKQDN